MSGRHAAASLAFGRWLSEPRDRRVVRYAVGSTIAMGIAMGFGWNLSFLVPVLSLSFLANPAARPGIKAGVTFVAVIAVACLFGLVVGSRLTPYPLVFLPFAALVLFRIFYAQTGGTSPLLITWLLIAFLVIPMIIMQASGLAVLIATSIVAGATVTIGVVMFAYWLIPEGSSESAAEAATVKPKPAAQARLRSALLSTAVVWPVMVLFYMFELANSLLILIFITLLSQQPEFAKNWQAGKALIVGNLIGGLVAIAFYELLVMVPEFGFLLLLTLLSGLVFGARVFSGRPTAPLYAMAFSTVLLVVGSTTSSTGEAGAKVYSRIIQMMLAVLYVVSAFGLIERLRRREGA